MAKYEVKTMRKDIEELRKKMKISDSELTELLGKEKGAPPEKLPVVLSKPPKPSKPSKPSRPKKLKKIELPKPPRPQTVPPKVEALPKPEAVKPRRHGKFIFPIIIIVIILLVAGGVYYWWNYLRIPEEESESEIEKPELEIPPLLIGVNGTKIIEIKEEEVLFEKLKEVAEQEQELGNFQGVLVKKLGKEKDYFLSFQEIAEILYINIPYNISSKLDLRGEHTLFLYTQEEGNRLGFVIRVSKLENLIENLKSWEEKMQTDIRPIFLGRILGFPASEEFQDNVYKDINIRYLNFPDPSLTIDYAVVGDYLVITTSRESIYKVIDKILGE